MCQTSRIFTGSISEDAVQSAIEIAQIGRGHKRTKEIRSVDYVTQ